MKKLVIVLVMVLSLLSCNQDDDGLKIDMYEYGNVKQFMKLGKRNVSNQTGCIKVYFFENEFLKVDIDGSKLEIDTDSISRIFQNDNTTIITLEQSYYVFE